jgi:hypothetical protein
MQAVSSTILDQIQKLDPPPRDATISTRTDSRQIHRGVPVSSSRNDPLPQDAFPTPLPNIPLPYELTLLDNLFVNPMVCHNKASDYTCGTKKGLDMAQQAQSQRQESGYTNPTQNNTFVSSNPQSLPPRAFQLAPNQSQPTYGNGNGNGNGLGNGQRLPQTSSGIGMGMGIGAYGMAAVGQSSTSTTHTPHIDPSNLYNLQTPGGSALPLPGTTAGEEGGSFDMFSFLMEEDAGLGNGWDSLEVPSDFSLWT